MNTRIRRTLIALAITAAVGSGTAWIFRGAGRSTDAAAAPSQPAAPQPRLVVDHYEHHFGVFDVGDKGKHVFTVRNEGDAPLELELLRTSCKCTLADLDKVSVPPGGKREVTLEWEAVDPTETFGHGARIASNDSEKREFNLLVIGRVRTKMGIWPDVVYLPDVPRGGERLHTVTLYSQAFDQVEITKIESSHPLITARLTDDPPISPPEREILFGRTLQLTCRADQSASYHGTVSVHYSATGPFAPKVESPMQFEVIVETVGDVSLHGRQVTGCVLNFGTVAAARGAKERVYLHVRNDDGRARPQLEKVSPEFLRVRFDEPQRLSLSMMRYPIEVEIPPGSPAATFVGDQAGEIRLKTGHPNNPQVRFKVALIVGQ